MWSARCRGVYFGGNEGGCGLITGNRVDAAAFLRHARYHSHVGFHVRGSYDRAACHLFAFWFLDLNVGHIGKSRS